MANINQITFGDNLNRIDDGYNSDDIDDDESKSDQQIEIEHHNNNRNQQQHQQNRGLPRYVSKIVKPDVSTLAYRINSYKRKRTIQPNVAESYDFINILSNMYRHSSHNNNQKHGNKVS